MLDNVTVKWKDDELYVYAGNAIRSICIVNGVVQPSRGRRVFNGSVAQHLLGRLPRVERDLVKQGFVLCLPALPLLEGLI